ncbi:MAG: DUF2190 family protein [Chromatiaceae bacterium]|nr:DUF2190 family protein [Chromatiaceae bacterium]
MSQQSLSLLTLTLTLSGTVTPRRFVTSTGAQTGADGNAIGVARLGGVSGDKVPVDVLGTAVVEAGAAIAVGATLKADASGRAITWVTAGGRLGVALEAAAAAGDLIECLLLDNAA